MKKFIIKKLLCIFALTGPNPEPSHHNQQRRMPPAMPKRTSNGVSIVILRNGPALRLEDGKDLPLSDEEVDQWIEYFSGHNP